MTDREMHGRFYLEPCPFEITELQNIFQQISDPQNGSASIEFYLNNKSKKPFIESYSIAILDITQFTQNPEIDSSSYLSAYIGDVQDDEKEIDDINDFDVHTKFNANFPIFNEIASKLKEFHSNLEIKFLKENEISLPFRFFTKIKSKDPLRICTSIPTKINDRLIFTYKDLNERDLIYKNFKYFSEQKQFTHFLALPISPNFPNWTESLVQVYKKFKLKVPKAIDLMHITLSLFVLENEEEIQLVNTLIEQAMKEIEWPAKRTLSFPNLGFFGTKNKAKILYIEPESNDFINCVTQFTLSFVSKMKDHGFGYIEESTSPYHITLIRPNFIKPGLISFNCQQYLDSYSENDLPDLEINEFRLVQRFVFDEDKFYHTNYHYPIS